MKIAVLDDYQNVALELADWSAVAGRAEITVFNDHVADPDAVVERLLPFEAVCVMRERTPLPREIIERLPRLKLIASTGSRNASIDTAAAEERGIRVTATGYRSTPTIEMTWALILASARHIVRESNSVRGSGWQTSIGRELEVRGDAAEPPRTHDRRPSGGGSCAAPGGPTGCPRRRQGGRRASPRP